ncbi:MAG: Crp/Fnr family transcriptional regulator [Paracoccaceae bacterium]
MPTRFFDHLLCLKHSQHRFSAGELIFERADPISQYYAVQSGEVHLLRRQEDGKAVILQRAVSGAILAEASFDAQEYHCSAVAATDSTLVVFNRESVRELLINDSAVALAFTAHLAREVQNARRRAEIMSLHRVADRVSAWLIWNDGTLPPKGSWHRMAAEIGVSCEALYRELARRR